jgi:serine O-acetyltransferase
MICASFKDCFLVDMKVNGQSLSFLRVMSLSFTESRVLAVVLMRLSQYFFHKKIIWRFAPWLKRLNEILTGFECHLSAVIGEGLFVAHSQNLVIGEGVVLGRNVTLYNGVTLGAGARGGSPDKKRYPVIGDGVTIYTGAKVIGFLHIGNGANIGANAVVINNIPSGAIAVGVPAKVLEKK